MIHLASILEWTDGYQAVLVILTGTGVFLGMLWKFLRAVFLKVSDATDSIKQFVDTTRANDAELFARADSAEMRLREHQDVLASHASNFDGITKLQIEILRSINQGNKDTARLSDRIDDIERRIDQPQRATT